MQHNKAGAHQTVVKRVSRKHDDHGHSGAWKVAFADFCLALLCLFLVLWLLASRNSERLQVVMKNAGANLIDEGNGVNNSLASGSRGSLIERHPVPAHGEVPVRGTSRESSNQRADGAQQSPRAQLDSPADLQKLAQVVQRLSAEEGLASNVNTVVTPQGLRLMLHDTDARGMFERGSAQPSERLRGLLRKLGPVFARVQNQLLIVGHTDATQYQDKGPGAFSNWALSSHRAMAARYHLLEGGMPEDSVLQVSGMADSAPLDAAHPQAARNRRIEMMVLTQRQSSAIAAMYGMPRPNTPVLNGPDSAEAMQELRQSLRPSAPN